MKNKNIFSLFFSLLTCAFTQAEMISSTNFEDWEKGAATSLSIFQEHGFQTGTWDNSLSTRTVIDTLQAASGVQSLKITYPTGGFGPDLTGCQVQLKFDKRDEAFASYYLRFSENFSWGTTSYGGKLPGLSGGNCCSGGASCDGTNGFSARLMWRTGGRGVLYLYHMDKPATYGEDHELIYPDGSFVTFERGKWYHIAERVKCNSDGDTYDGEVEIWVNGQQVLLRKGLRFTSNGDKVDDLYISTFHGGDDDTWAPTDTCYTWLDDIRIGTSYEDVVYQSCQKPELGENKTLCTGAKSIQLTASNIGQDTKYTWLYNNTPISSGKEISVWNTGQYILVTDSDWCSRRDTVELTNTFSLPEEEEVHICSNSFAHLTTNIEEDENIQFEWRKEGQLLAEKKNILKIKDAGIYTVAVSSPYCDTKSTTFIVTSGLLSIRDTSGKEGEEITLAIQEDGSYAWFDDESLTHELTTGNTYTTTVGTADKYLYVKDKNGYSGLVGKPALSANYYTRNNFSTEWMLFTVERELTIDSISIYPVQDLTAVIRIVDDATGNVIATKTFDNLSPGECRLLLNITLQPGKYRMDANGTTASLYHSHTDEDILFPYTVDGLISIEGSNYAWINNKPWYLFFYNWRISSGNTCAATPVLLKNNDATDYTTVSYAGTKVYPKFTDGELFIEGLPASAQVNINTTSGKKMLSKKTKQQTIHFLLTEWKNGSYIVEIKSNEGIRTFRILKY